MYMYTKKKSPKLKKRILLGLSACLCLMVGVMSYSYMNRSQPKAKDTPVFAENEMPVIDLPAKAEKAIRPYTVEAKIVLDYFDGSAGDVESISEFEGTYRANQGCDYAFENQEFDVIAIYSGEVSDVKEDALFGHSVTIKTNDISITYQSLKDVTVKKGDKVSQGDIIGKASANIYNKDLQNHLHVVVEKNGTIMDPENIYGLKVSEIK